MSDKDTIYRQDAIDAIERAKTARSPDGEIYVAKINAQMNIQVLPSAQPERLTDDDFETIRIHLNACKEKLCNQRRWKEAEEYQRIIDRFIAFASAEPERKKGGWIFATNAPSGKSCYVCSECGAKLDSRHTSYCGNCGSKMER